MQNVILPKRFYQNLLSYIFWQYSSVYAWQIVMALGEKQLRGKIEYSSEQGVTWRLHFDDCTNQPRV